MTPTIDLLTSHRSIRHFTNEPITEAQREAIINSAQGNSLNLVVTPQSDALLTIQQALRDAGLPTFGIAQSRPSLDDVYLAATGKTLLDAELAAAGTRDPKAERKQNMR